MNNSSDLELDCNAWALIETGDSGLLFRRMWEQEGRDETVAQARGLTSCLEFSTAQAVVRGDALCGDAKTALSLRTTSAGAERA